MEAWRGFTEGNWSNEIDVRNFISLNYTPYLDGPEFLEGPTERTKRVSKRLDDLLRQEFEKGYPLGFLRYHKLITSLIMIWLSVLLFFW